jgi:hypothetical protein
MNHREYGIKLSRGPLTAAEKREITPNYRVALGVSFLVVWGLAMYGAVSLVLRAAEWFS